ncbi:MFS transporter [Romboutsia sp.]|uniref:MDR family MFS transporter n=1 Tax=Romboutsia sp. TaxID=1965302 RepID=UPI002D161353|nr:MFS transporter [Romboutsia sp.]HSQ89907.1 MFS transporter [Romboutsia sp.]
MKNLLSTYKGLPKEIYVLFIGKIVNCIGAFVHPLMSLILTQRVGMSAFEAGKFITMLAICQVPCMILGGKLSDSIGRRKVIIVFQILGASMLVICGLLPTTELTAKIMILSACFYAISSPAYDALNADLTHEGNRKEAYSLLYMGINIGFSIGPILGGFLYKNYLPLIFIGDAFTTIIALILFIIYVEEPKKIISKKDIYEKEEYMIDKYANTSTIKVLFQKPILILFPIIMILYQFSYSQWGFSLPLQMGELFGEDGAKLYGFLGAFNAVIVILSTPILTHKTKEYNSLNVMSLGGVLYGLCFLVIVFSKVMPLFFIAVFLLTLGEVLIAINNSAFIANNTPPSHRGRISSIIPIVSGIGYALGPMVMGKIIDSNGIFMAWMLVTVVSFIGALELILLKKLTIKEIKHKNLLSRKNN